MKRCLFFMLLATLAHADDVESAPIRADGKHANDNDDLVTTGAVLGQCANIIFSMIKLGYSPNKKDPDMLIQTIGNVFSSINNIVAIGNRTGNMADFLEEFEQIQTDLAHYLETEEGKQELLELSSRFKTLEEEGR